MSTPLNRPLIQKHLPRLLDLADVYDQSFSFSAIGTEHRALLGWYTPNAPIDILANMFIDWGIPQQFVQQWRMNTPDTEGVGISFNQDLSSLRLYTHKWSDLTLDDTGVAVYKGFKLLKDQTLRLDEYINFGDLRSHDNMAYAQSRSKYPEWVERLNQLAAGDAPLLFTRTTNTGRQSWLVTARYADLTADTVAGPAFAGYKLLHLAGGIDTVKGEFSTVYIQTERSDVQRFLDGQLFEVGDID
jgi:hypothetical protein